jgi:pimeloyl-ACP methyl ester carboxylesterase
MIRDPIESRAVDSAPNRPRRLGRRISFARPGRGFAAIATVVVLAAVMADGAYPTGKDVSEGISRHYLHDPRTNLWLRALFVASSFPGVAHATALAYYFRSGIYLGPELLSVIPSASRIRVPVLLISGERDWIVPTDKARQILSVIRGDRKELVVIPNAVHDTTYRAAPTLYASTVLSFLDRSIR